MEIGNNYDDCDFRKEGRHLGNLELVLESGNLWRSILIHINHSKLFTHLQNHCSGVRSGIGSNTRFSGVWGVLGCLIVLLGKKIMQELKYNFVGLYFQ